jgi:hypothetical protein
MSLMVFTRIFQPQDWPQALGNAVRGDMQYRESTFAGSPLAGTYGRARRRIMKKCTKPSLRGVWPSRKYLPLFGVSFSCEMPTRNATPHSGA